MVIGDQNKKDTYTRVIKISIMLREYMVTFTGGNFKRPTLISYFVSKKAYRRNEYSS